MASHDGVSRRPVGLDDLLLLCGEPLPESCGAKRAYDVAGILGPIGALWLRPQVLDLAREWIRSYHGDPAVEPAKHNTLLRRGEIGILLALPSPLRYPLLKPAFVLPLEWRAGAVCSPRLPQGLAAFAARVLEDVRVTRLSLHLPQWLEDAGADFSGLTFSFDSAWAMLAAGAIVAAEGGSTVPGVLASAAWTRRDGEPQGSIGRVQLFRIKIEAAAASGATTLFLPEEQRRFVEQGLREARSPGLTVQYLSNAPAKPGQALAPLLHALEAAPRLAANASFEQCCGYYTRTARAQQNDYFRDELLTALAEKMRPALARESAVSGVDGVVVIASPNWAVACLVVELFQPQRVLLLHDGKVPRELAAIAEWLNRSAQSSKREIVMRQCRSRDGFTDDVETAVRNFSGRCSRIVVDLTGGYRHYMFALLAALPPNAVATYIDAEVDDRYRAVMPATSELRVLDLSRRAL